MRLGVLDVGSNTVHLLIVETHSGARPNPIASVKTELRLIDYINQDGVISEPGTKKLTDVIRKSIEAAHEKEVQEILPFATSALRDATNGSQVIKEINTVFNIDLQVMSGEDEARTTFLAARRWFGWSSGRLLVCDIGGGSLEIAVGVDETPDVAMSLPLGASRLTNNFLEGDPFSKKSIRALRDYVENQLQEVLPALLKHQDTDRVVATSKTFRTLARLAKDWIPGNDKAMSASALRTISQKLGDMSLEERQDLPGVSTSRARQIVAGAIVAESVMRNLNIDSIEICPWALREGLVLKWLDWMEA